MARRMLYGEEGGKPPSSGKKKKKEEASSPIPFNLSLRYNSVRGMGIPTPVGSPISYEKDLTYGDLSALRIITKGIPKLSGYTAYVEQLMATLPKEMQELKLIGTNEKTLLKSIEEFKAMVENSPNFQTKADALKIIAELQASGFVQDAAGLLPNVPFKEGRNPYKFDKLSRLLGMGGVKELSEELGAALAMHLWNTVEFDKYMAFGKDPQGIYISVHGTGYPHSDRLAETGIKAMAGGTANIFGFPTTLHLGYMKNPDFRVNVGNFQVTLPPKVVIAKFQIAKEFGSVGASIGAGGALFTSDQLSISLANENGGNGLLITLPTKNGAGVLDLHASTWVNLSDSTKLTFGVLTTPSIGLNYVTKDGVETTAEPSEIANIQKVTVVPNLLASFALQATIKANLPVAGKAFLVTAYAPKSGYDFIVKLQPSIGLFLPGNLSIMADYSSKEGLRDLNAELGLDFDFKLLQASPYVGAGLHYNVQNYYFGVNLRY